MQKIEKLNTLRFVLILLVVFGHFLEMFKGAEEIYIIIYTFHMAAFVFVSGYLAKFSKKKILKLVMFYLIFQTIWGLCDSIQNKYLCINYFVPYWIMWYLFALIIFYALLPLFDVKERYKQFLILLSLFCLSLIAGYIGWVGYNFSLSRIFTFMPIFFLGYYLKNSKIFNELILFENAKLKYVVSLKIIAILTIPLLIYLTIDFPFNKYMLYGSHSYSFAGFNPAIKIFIYFLSITWTFLLLILLPKQKILIISHIGENTMPIYLLHGFILRPISVLNYTFNLNMLICTSCSLLIVFLLGNKYITKIVNLISCETLIFHLLNNSTLKYTD